MMYHCKVKYHCITNGFQGNVSYLLVVQIGKVHPVDLHNLVTHLIHMYVYTDTANHELPYHSSHDCENRQFFI